MLAHVGRQVRHLTLGRARRQVRKKQIRLGDALGAARLHHGLIGREQAHRLMRRAFDHFIQIGGERFERVEQRLTPGCVEHDLATLRHLQQAFAFFGQLGYAIEPDNFQCAMRLVQVGFTKLELGCVRRIGQIGSHGRASLGQRLLDFPFDPRQRTNIKFRCCAHFTRLKFCRCRDDSRVTRP